MVSSELPEVLGMSHRILVVRDGTIAAEFARAEATPEKRHRRRDRSGGVSKQASRLAYSLRIAGGGGGRSIALVVIVDVASHGSFLQPSNIVRVLRQITYNCDSRRRSDVRHHHVGHRSLGRLAGRAHRRRGRAVRQLDAS